MVKISNLEIIYAEMGAGKIFVDAIVKGEQEKFFLDTGSTETFIHKPRWKNESVVETSNYYSASGAAVTFNYIKLPDISIFDITKSSIQVGLIEDPNTEPQKLGLNIFKDESVNFDFHNKRLSRALAINNSSNKFIFGKKGHVILPAKIGKTELTCIFDTGAGFSAIDMSCIEENSSLFNLIDGDGVAGDGNGIQMPCGLYNLTKLRVGDTEFSNSNIVGIDLGSLKNIIGVDGPIMVLGFSHLVHRNWQFDFKNLKFTIVDF